MSKNPTRRETLGIIGAAGLTALVGCSDDTGDTNSPGAGATGGAGAGGTGTGGAGAGGAGAGGAGTGGMGTGGLGGSGATGGTGGAGTGGTGGAGTGGSGSGGTAGDGGSGSGGTAGDGAGGTGGGAGSGGAGSGGGGAGGNGGSGGGGQVDCKEKEETTVGPYPNINPLDRRDVRGNTTGTTSAKEGAELVLKLGVYDLDANCAPIAGATVDMWQCDAVGDYAGYSAFNTVGQDYCRGYRATDANGIAEFLTIFPGSYTGRAIHIHFSIQGGPSDLRPNDEGANLPNIMVAQLYFTKELADEVFAAFPIYQQGAPITQNEADSIYSQNGGADLIVKMTKNGTGYVGEVAVGVRRSEIGL